MALAETHDLQGDEKVDFKDRLTHCCAVAESKFLKDLKAAKRMGPNNNQDAPVDHNPINLDALLHAALKALTARRPLHRNNVPKTESRLP